MPRVSSRYRIEDGRSCIDVRLKSARQLFDLRDPAPFRERDLDPGAAEHLMTCLREIPFAQPVRIVFFVTDDFDPEMTPEVLRDALRGHFEHELHLVDRSIRENFRHGRHLLAIGLVALGVFLTLSRLSSRWFAHLGVFHEILREGMVITGWVAMWRPAEVLLYDWWPLREERRWVEKMMRTEVRIERMGVSVVPDAARLGA